MNQDQNEQPSVPSWENKPQPSKGGKIQLLGFEESIPSHERITVRMKSVRVPIRE